MGEYINQFIIGGLVALSGAAVIALIAGVKWLAGLKSSLAQIVGAVEKINADVCDLYEIQGPQLVAQKAMLEGMKGQINGNVDHAIEKMAEAQGLYDAALLKNMGHSCKDAA